MDILRSPSKNNMSNIRDLFAPRDAKDKVPPDLRHPIALLGLKGYEDLEERFLATDAFLKPWSVFRDSMLLLAPEVMPQATLIKGAGSGISRLDLLWFYTQFDEGVLRYDPRADKYSVDYTPDTSVYGMIDKSNWRVEEYEKHLFAWLLQEFKVGKAYSPWRFTCLELKNICTAWEDVFVPIVNAVRASYDARGRRYYGRLAVFVEARCPSRLAFPDSNINIPEGGVLSPTPYRIVSAPKKTPNIIGARMSYSQQDNSYGVLSRKHYDDTEKELRNVYPQYGGLVERPKFKQNMDEWLAEQRARADRRKDQHQRHGEVQSSRPQVVQRNGSRSPTKQLLGGPRGGFRKQPRVANEKEGGGGSPIKQFADSIIRSFSRKEEEKSSRNGVTRQLQFPERKPKPQQIDDSARSSMIITPLPRPDPQYRMPSEASIYTSIRNSNPFTEDIQSQVKARVRANSAESVYTPKSQRARANTADSVYSPQNKRTRTDADDSIFSPMGQLSAIPRPLWPEPEDHRSPPKSDPASRYLDAMHERPAVRQRKSYHEVRIPSYEGNSYQEEISLTDLHNQRLQAARSPESARSAKLATRLPAPIMPIPYSGPRLASADQKAERPLSKAVVPLPKPSRSPSKPQAVVYPPQAIVPPRAIARPVESNEMSKKGMERSATPPKTKTWPGYDSDSESTPPTPSRSPDRHNRSRNPGQLRNPHSRQLMHEEHEHEMSRIVSKENIRAALGGVSRESSAESLVPPKPFLAPVRSMSPLQPYNTHLFPRKEEHKGTPVGKWFKEKEEEGRCEKDGAFELEVLNVDRKDDEA